MSLKINSLTHKGKVTVSALIDPNTVSCGSVHPVTKSYRVGSGAPSAYKGHNGIDIFASHGSPIYSISDGTVFVNKFEKGGAGNYVSVHSLIDGKQLKLLYMHLKDKSKLKVGAKIKRGDLIGYQGSTGNSTGSHLHLGIKCGSKYLDPYPFILADDQEQNDSCVYLTGKYQVVANVLNIRQRPNTTSRIISKARCGDIVNVNGLCLGEKLGAWGKCEQGWLCLCTANKEVYAKFIEQTTQEAT